MSANDFDDFFRDDTEQTVVQSGGNLARQRGM
jgi:hypothetical protein